MRGHDRPIFLLPYLAVALLAAVAAPVRAGVDAVAVWAGSFDVLGSEDSTELGMELRLDPFVRGERPVSWSLSPAAGVMGTSDDALYGHVGFRLELPVPGPWGGRRDRVVLTPQVAAGYYDRGDDEKLGGNLQFRSGLEAAVRLTRRHSVGVLFYHLSNAGIDDRNPGVESLVVQWSVTF